MKAFIFATAVSLAAAAPALAQSEAAAQPAPCSDEIFHDFDFWIGEWEVFGVKGQKAGENSITVEENGCLLVERWTANQGGTGQSYNFVDLGAKKWRQVWVSAGATIDYDGGLNKKGEMVLKGEIAYPNGRTASFRGTWTPQDDGSVKQHFEQLNADTKKWDDWFIGIYKKKAADQEG